METLNIEVNNELIKITNWLNNNKLSLNYTKTSCFLISPQVNNLEFVVRINGNHIKISDVKYLGITLQPKLRWYNHINILCKKLSRASGIIAKLRHYVDNKILLGTYYSLVQSHLLYGMLTWGSENTTTLKPLQTNQNKIVRLMCKVHKTSHVTNNSFYTRLSILKIIDLYKVELAKFFHSYQRNRLPQIFQDYFQPVKSLHKHFTRNLHTDKFYLPVRCSVSFAPFKFVNF